MLLTERLQLGTELSSAQRSVVTFMLENVERLPNLTTREIADEVHTSPATLIRLAKNLGFDGFAPLKAEYLEEQRYLQRHVDSVDPNTPFKRGDRAATIAQNMAALHRGAIDDTLALLTRGTQLNEAISLLAKAHTIFVVATSMPLLAAQWFQLNMMRIGRRVTVTPISGEQLFAAGLAQQGDCVIVASYSGETPDTVAAARLYRKLGLPIVSITSIGSNTVRDLADISLSITSREKLYSKIAGFAGQEAFHLVFDVLYAGIFGADYDRNYAMRIRLSRQAEPGRYSTSQQIGENL